ncbi:MAG: hypothetical protein HGA72_05300 [Chlorobiaceae bacterium]|nr:hypothetical protein [Chlorobiaceae bacterium]
MKRITIPTLLAFMLLLCQSLSFASISQFTGTWKNADQNTRGVTKLTIAGNGNALKMRAWGKCQPQDCDWGEVNAYPFAPDVSSGIEQNAQAVTATFNTGFSQTQVIARPLSRSTLRVDTYTRFTDNSGRSNYTSSYTFNRQLVLGPIRPIGPIEPIRPTPLPQPLPAFEEDCIAFNSASTTLRNIDGRWTIADGGHLLFNFGPNRSEALQALRIIKYYRMNLSCFVGRPDPSFQYLLVNGNAPQGSMPGEDCVSFNPNSIEVKNIGGSWKIVDGSHWIFDFGSKEDEARKAFAIIKKHGFTRSCYVGRPNASFQYLRK